MIAVKVKVSGTVAERIFRCHYKMVAIGGDEFAIMQTALKEPTDAAALAKRVREAITAPFELAGHQIRGPISVNRAGITTVIIPKENEKDLAEVPDNVKTGLKIVPVATVGEVLKGLPEGHGLAYNTVLTTLRILEQKGYLRHVKPGGAAAYLGFVIALRLTDEFARCCRRRGCEAAPLTI